MGSVFEVRTGDCLLDQLVHREAMEGEKSIPSFQLLPGSSFYGSPQGERVQRLGQKGLTSEPLGSGCHFLSPMSVKYPSFTIAFTAIHFLTSYVYLKSCYC